MIPGRRPKPAEDTKTVARVRQVLEEYAATAPGQDVHVSVAHMLDYLNPRGLWSLDPDRVRALRRTGADTGPMPAVDQDADPLTGCKPAHHQA